MNKLFKETFLFSHANRHGLKTNAPLSFLWDMLRSISLKNNLDPLKNLHPDSPGYKIMSKPPCVKDISFEPHPQANPPSREIHLTRFQINPESNWGPKARSRTSLIPEKSVKQTRNQGKHKNSGSKDADAKKPKCDNELVTDGDT